MPALLFPETVERTNHASAADDAISVLIVGNDRSSRVGIERLLVTVDGITLHTLARGEHPDVVLVVAEAIDDEVLGWIDNLREHRLSRILVVATATRRSITQVTEAGASGVMSRSLADGPRLEWAIRGVQRGEAIVLIAPDERRDPPGPAQCRVEGSPNAVSPRDRQVLRLLAEGCDTGEIARALNFSEPTIKNVIQKLFEQLKAKNRPHAVALALRSGII